MKKKGAVAVVGLGRVGLPLALALARGSRPVIGVDSDPVRADTLARGDVPCREAGLGALLEAVLGKGLEVTTDLDAAARQADAFVIAINAPLNERLLPHQEPLVELGESILAARGGRPTTFLMRSTVAPGFSRLFLDRLRRRFRLRGGLRYAYCPDRTAEGRFLEEMGIVPQLIGAPDTASAEMARAVLAPMGAPFLVTGLEEAELAKLFNSAYRCVNFALANECLLLADLMGANPHEALRAARAGYERGGPWHPGLAAGPGLFKDGFFLQWGLPGVDLLLTAWKINEGLVEQLVRRAEAVRPLRRPAVLGVAFKAGVDDRRFSPGERLVHLLRARGLQVAVHDPTGTFPGSSPRLEEALAGAGEAFLAIPDAEYRRLDREDLGRLMGPKALLVDPWGVWVRDGIVATLG